MEVLILDGKKYIKAARAAGDLGYTSDYVGQLCRSGQVNAHIIGRSWYVDMDALRSHRVEKKRMSRVKAREQARRTIAEHRARVATGQEDGTDSPISYEHDGSELIPETRKVEVKTWEPKSKRSTKVSTPPGERDRPEDDAATGEEHPVTTSAAEGASVSATVFEPEIVVEEERVERRKKRSMRSAALRRRMTAEAVAGAPASTTAQPAQVARSPRAMPWILPVSLCLVLAVATLPLSAVLIYDANSTNPVTTMFAYQIDETADLLKNLPNLVNPI